MFKVNNKNTRTTSKSYYAINMCHIFPVLLLLPLNKEIQLGKSQMCYKLMFFSIMSIFPSHLIKCFNFEGNCSIPSPAIVLIVQYQLDLHHNLQKNVGKAIGQCIKYEIHSDILINIYILREDSTTFFTLTSSFCYS